VKEYSDDTIEIEPRILVDPRIISKKTLAMIDESIESLKRGDESDIIDVDKMVKLADGLQD
ncbi:MAG: hypothetical protein JW795_15955, partial [Chitinivibrionales bacterium]|nr:hypothetical protein [Chitinivibrionales bacterium]